MLVCLYFVYLLYIYAIFDQHYKKKKPVSGAKVTTWLIKCNVFVIGNVGNSILFHGICLEVGLVCFPIIWVHKYFYFGRSVGGEIRRRLVILQIGQVIGRD